MSESEPKPQTKTETSTDQLTEFEDAPEAPVLQPQLPPAPGPAIKAARASANLSLEDLSAETKLARATLEALEADQFELLSESVYVKGYYRKCAKVLGLDGDRLIEGYLARVPKAGKPSIAAPPGKVLLSDGDSMDTASGGRWWLAILIIALVLGLLAWWWQRADINTEAPPVLVAPPVMEPSSRLDPPAGRPALVLESRLSGDDEARGAESAPPPVPQRRKPTVQLSESLSQPDESGSVSSAGRGSENAPAQQASAPATQTAPAQGPEQIQSSDRAVDESAAGGSDPAASGPELVLRFKQSSWVRIEDASGRTLMSGLKQGGLERKVAGVTPYSIFLGNAPGIDLSFDGATVNLQPLTRENNTARLTLP